MDTLIRERNGKEEIWYSESYVKRQIELAYHAGIHKGIRVEFHAIKPMNQESVDNLVAEFNRIVYEEYQKLYNDIKVWQKG